MWSVFLYFFVGYCTRVAQDAFSDWLQERSVIIPPHFYGVRVLSDKTVDDQLLDHGTHLAISSRIVVERFADKFDLFAWNGVSSADGRLPRLSLSYLLDRDPEGLLQAYRSAQGRYEGFRVVQYLSQTAEAIFREEMERCFPDDSAMLTTDGTHLKRLFKKLDLDLKKALIDDANAALMRHVRETHPGLLAFAEFKFEPAGF